ncbi:hypothetical protein SEA_SAPO_27 [Gordonia phage Sapo]|nr:hypothetical protein SEA_SAPO_27 [Gordonia phage Sapo]
MALPNARYRTQPKKQVADPTFVQGTGAATTNSSPTCQLSTAAGSKVFVGATSNTGTLALRVDGNSTPVPTYGQVTATRLQFFWVLDLAPGLHTFNVDGGGSWETLAVVEYQGVNLVGPYTSKVSSSQVQTHTPDGAGKLALALVASATVGGATGADPANYVGTLRQRQVGGSNNQSVAWVDNLTAPLGLQASGVAASVGCVWLS